MSIKVITRPYWFFWSTKHTITAENVDQTEPLYRSGATAVLRVEIDGRPVRRFHTHFPNTVDVVFHDEDRAVRYYGIDSTEIHNMAGLWTTEQIFQKMSRALNF